MGAAELVELALDIGNRVDVQWGLFVTVHLAALGAMAYVDEPLHPIEKVVALVIYFGFAGINFAQMHAQLALLHAAYTDIAALAPSQGGALVKQMTMEHDAGRHRYAELVVMISHGLMLILVTLSVIYHPLMTKKDRPAS